MTLLDGAASTEIHRRGRRPSPLAMGLEEDFNILIEALFIFFDRPEIMPMPLHDLRAEGTAIKHGIATDPHAAQLDLTQHMGGRRDFTAHVLDIHLSQHPALF